MLASLLWQCLTVPSLLQLLLRLRRLPVIFLSPFNGDAPAAIFNAGLFQLLRSVDLNHASQQRR